jgi:hypothetical protein
VSIVPGRRRDELSVPALGTLFFCPLALSTGYFLEGVERVLFNGQAALVARPLRALLDRCCLLKLEWTGLDALLDSLRIDPDDWAMLPRDELETLKPVYRHRRMHLVIDAMQQEWAA